MFRTTWNHIRRTPYQALAAIMIMTFTFFVAAVFILLAGGSQIILRYFEAKPQITAFFTDKATKEDLNSLKNNLSETGKVAGFKYVSKEEALKIYKEQNKNDPLLLEMVSADILPASLEISSKEVTDLSTLYDIAKKQPKVEEVIFQKDVVNTLTTWTGGIRKIGVVILAFLSIVSILIIWTVIGMKIAIRKDEIEILKLLGATNWYIRWPFLLEGMTYGIIGALLAWIVAFISLWRATPFLSSFLSGIPLLPVPPLFMLLLLGILSGGGLLVGTIGSLLAVKRYLK